MNEEKTDEELYGKNCPICGTSWKKTPKFSSMDFFYECTKCEKKASVLMKEAENKKSEPNYPGWFYGDTRKDSPTIRPTNGTVVYSGTPPRPLNTSTSDDNDFDEMLKELEEMLANDSGSVFLTDYRGKSEWKL